MSRVVGIDLGTTNCCVAVMDGFKPKVIPNKQGYNTTPSVLAVTDNGRRVVGQIAMRQAVTNPKHTVYGAKRLIGREFHSDEVQHAQRHVSYDVLEGPHGDVRIRLRDEELSVAELSAMFLQEMRLVAEDYLDHPVEQAVVTVPAYFNDNQRQAVRDAGRIAGLDVLRILNEPTAAALAYGFGMGEPKTIAIYDLGGGTFDISVVRIDEAGDFHVVATTGDSYLGGEDFDERIMDHLMGAFENENGVDLRGSPLAIARLRQAAQKSKAELSDLPTSEISLPFIGKGDAGPLHLETVLARDTLESITADLVTRTLQICEVGLQYAEMRPEEVDEVILVGGMTRMPAIQRAVSEYFGKPPCKGVHPDEVVALGAAIVADAVARESDDVRLHDVTAHSLGIMTAGGGFDPLIAANTSVPTQVREVFGTSRDGQSTVKIVVLQGESERAKENDALGRFALNGLREAPAGEVEVEVAFTINEEGLFSVGAKDLETGEEKVIDVLASSGLSEEEIQAMMADSADYLAERRSSEAHKAAQQACITRIDAIRSRLPEAESRMALNPVGADAVKQAKKAANIVAAELETATVQALRDHEAHLERVQGMLEHVLQASV
ncbi:MAG: molecular chaperone DnaK [Sandaracinaceae bacterium]